MKPHPPVTNRRIAAVYHGHPILQHFKEGVHRSLFGVRRSPFAVPATSH
jgi:hypothetical protein